MQRLLLWLFIAFFIRGIALIHAIDYHKGIYIIATRVSEAFLKMRKFDLAELERVRNQG